MSKIQSGVKKINGYNFKKLTRKNLKIQIHVQFLTTRFIRSQRSGWWSCLGRFCWIRHESVWWESINNQSNENFTITMEIKHKSHTKHKQNVYFLYYPHTFISMDKPLAMLYIKFFSNCLTYTRNVFTNKNMLVIFSLSKSSCVILVTVSLTCLCLILWFNPFKNVVSFQL